MTNRLLHPTRWPVLGGFIRFFRAVPKLHRIYVQNRDLRNDFDSLMLRMDDLSSSVIAMRDEKLTEVTGFILNLNHEFHNFKDGATARIDEIDGRNSAGLQDFVLDLNYRFHTHEAAIAERLRELAEQSLPELKAFVLDMNHRLHLQSDAAPAAAEGVDTQALAELTSFVLDLNHRVHLQAEALAALPQVAEKGPVVDDTAVAELTNFVLELNHKFHTSQENAASLGHSVSDVRSSIVDLDARFHVVEGRSTAEITDFVLGLNHRHAMLEAQVGTLLEHVSAAKSVGFALVRCQRELAALQARAAEVDGGTLPELAALTADLRDRNAQLVKQMSTLTEHVSTAKVVGFDVVRMRREMAILAERIDAPERSRKGRTALVQSV